MELVFSINTTCTMLVCAIRANQIIKCGAVHLLGESWIKEPRSLKLVHLHDFIKYSYLV